MIFVVLGMHKSGTTLVSQILYHSGITMGDFDESTSYDHGNKYERQTCLGLNLEILNAPDFEILHLEADGELSLTDGQSETMHEIIRTNEANNSDWGFKDPRCCLTYRLWSDELPEHCFLPAEVRQFQV